jgi:hypothetical protein
MPGPKIHRTQEEMENDTSVQARFKTAGEDDWFNAKLTDDHRLYRTDTMEEITRTDLYLKAEFDDEIVDLEEELENYRVELLRERLHFLAKYLAKQTLENQKSF